MTLKHRFSLIVPKIKWLIKRIKRVRVAYRRLKKANALLDLRQTLQDNMLANDRKNTDESLRDAYAMSKQIELIDIILGEKHDV